VTGSVIEFDRVTKVYPGASTPSVDNVSFTVGAGQVCALVGPSGSGKTTAMRMVNRLVEPSHGQVRIDGRDTRQLDVEHLRRSIGYVIQQVGLFPHRTVIDNVATVPRLLGWDDGRALQRSAEMLSMVGLDPSMYGNRYPSQLSGGQRQRVGVARALAADPPVLLMDEPFGAIDPVVREHIQDEFLALQRNVRKTIVIVTHDLDEAMRMADVVAVLAEGGRLAQFAPPDELLATPANDMVRTFVGADSALRRMSLVTLAQLPMWQVQQAAQLGMPLVIDEHGRPVSWANGAAVMTQLSLNTNLRAALSELLGANASVAPVVDDHGRAVGIVTTDLLVSSLHPVTADTRAARWAG
jgi:osmoprotectant transport system ATP-binding protein